MRDGVRRRAYAAGALLALCLVLSTTARAQVSPGPLARAHASMEGNLGCVKCHGKAKGDMDRKCLACHEEIAWLIANGRGYHAREGKTRCASCHPDHGGADFALIAWPGGSPQTFDHGKTGFALRGQHASVGCEKCHSRAHIDGAVAAKVKRRSGAAWAGLDRNCRTCHDDIHRGALGADCAGCHDETGWRPARNFDHAKTSYPLTGKHATVKCAGCHEAAHLQLARDTQGRVKPLYKPLPHGECGPCHADVHKGAFGNACSRCHTTIGFRTVNTASFDHDKTHYPLRGGHVRVACARCHDEKTAWGKKPPYATCAGCHRDPHAGQATLAGKAVDCAACHTVDAYRPSTFTVAAHARTKYALDGAHAGVACVRCHGQAPPGNAAQVAGITGSAKVWFHPNHDRCIECHHDPHGGRFAPGGERARRDDCRACHTMDAFHPSTMDAAAHDAARFKLEGAHRAAPCFACHAELAQSPAAGSKTRSLPFVAAKQACGDCHATPHGNQFDARKDAGTCDSCHDVERFKPASRFDHGKTRFVLDGKHAKVPCAKCHDTVTSAGKRVVRYVGVPSKCEDCHASDGVLKR